MSYMIRNRENPVGRCCAVLALCALMTTLTSCNKLQKSASEPTQKTFASPADAGAAFRAAAMSGDRSALLAIFGPDSQGVLFSGDAIKDKDYLQYFVTAYDQMHRWREIKAGGEFLYIGADNYSFPIPLGKNPSGLWYFDTAAGKDEILARRIGKDELTAIAACSAIADAEQQYFSQPRDGDTVKQYAGKFISDEGKQNGLYWPVSAGEPTSPFEDVRDFAKAAGYSNADEKPQPFNGYYYRLITKQGDRAKFAALAYPVEYRDSGIMTFIVGPDGIVYQKDLGEKTGDLAASLSEFNPGDGWQPAL